MKYRGIFKYSDSITIRRVLGDYIADAVYSTLGCCSSLFFWVDIDDKWLMVWEHK